MRLYFVDTYQDATTAQLLDRLSKWKVGAVSRLDGPDDLSIIAVDFYGDADTPQFDGVEAALSQASIHEDERFGATRLG